jgi:hypothetical protein
MKNTVLTVLYGVVTVATSLAQPTTVVKSADEAWANVVALSKPAPSVNVPGKKRTLADVAAENSASAKRSREASLSAKAFYTAYPTHLNARNAQKLEAILALLGVTDDDKAFEQVARQIAKTYRENRANSVADRFEVALLAERVEIRSKLGGRIYGNSPEELEKIGDKLRIEFGNTPEVFNFYVSVARVADMSAAQALAAKIISWPATPEAKAEAQSILARHALVGTTLNWKLITIDNSEFDLAKQASKITIIYVWTPVGEGDGLAPLNKVKKSLPPNTQIVYFPLGMSVGDVRTLQPTAPLPGIFCYELRGAIGPTAEKFQVRHTPYIFVLNRAGVLSGFGPAGELASLLTTAVH